MFDDTYDLLTKHLFNGFDRWWKNPVSYFSDVKWNDLMQLEVSKVLDGNYKSKYYAPTINEILNFMQEHISKFTCHGKVVIKDGKIEIIIEGFYCTEFIEKDKKDFIDFCIDSDILRVIETPPILYNRW